MIFVLINQSTLTAPEYGGEMTQAFLQQAADTLSAYLNEDLSREYGGGFVVRVGQPDGSDLSSREAPVYIVDSLPNVPGAAAYHDRTDAGQPVIYTTRDEFTSLTDGPGAWTVGAGHELAETVGDPGANRLALRLDGKTAEAFELCDRPQGSCYQKGGMTVPDFLLNAAFAPGAPRPYSFLDVLDTYDAMTPDGYAILYQATQQPDGSMGFAPHAVGIDLARMHPTKLERKRHPSSRTYRRGVRL